MYESEFLQIIDHAFANIGYQIKKEVPFESMRIDRFVTNTCRSYYIEAENDKTSFSQGIQQLAALETSKSSYMRSPLEGGEYASVVTNVLAIPELTPNLIEIAENRRVRVLVSDRLEKMLNSEVAKPSVIFPHHSDLARMVDDFESQFVSFHNYHQGLHNGSAEILEIRDPKASPEGNWYPLVRMVKEIKGEHINEISFFSGIKQSHIKEGRREEESSELQNLQKRVPTKYALDKLGILEKSYLMWGTNSISPNLFYPVFEKIYHMAFGDIEPQDLEYTMYESIDPFAL